jgi:hypothetical protein
VLERICDNGKDDDKEGNADNDDDDRASAFNYNGYPVKMG